MKLITKYDSQNSFTQQSQKLREAMDDIISKQLDFELYILDGILGVWCNEKRVSKRKLKKYGERRFFGDTGKEEYWYKDTLILIVHREWIETNYKFYIEKHF